MKKNVSLFVLLFSIIQVVFTSESYKIRQEQRPVLRMYDEARLKSQKEAELNTPPVTPRNDPGKLPSKLLLPQASEKDYIDSITPRTNPTKLSSEVITPRLSSEYFIPYFFDGTIQYVFFKKEVTKVTPVLRVTRLNLSLIPLEEKNVFISLTSAYFKIIEESGLLGGLNSVWLEKIQDIPVKGFNGYELREFNKTLVDESLPWEVKKKIEKVKKTIIFIPLFYQKINKELTILFKKDEQSTQQRILEFILPTKSVLSVDGLQKEIEIKVKSIINDVFKTTDATFSFSPTLILEYENTKTYMQPINVFEADLNDIKNKQYGSYSLGSILNFTSSEKSVNKSDMKKYIESLHEKVKIKMNNKEKIDELFDEFFLKRYEEYEQQKKALENRIKAQAAEQKRLADEKEQQRKKDQEEKEAAEVKRIEKLKQQPLEISKTPDIQESNKKPSDVIQQSKAEKERIEKELDQKKAKEKEKQVLSSQQDIEKISPIVHKTFPTFAQEQQAIENKPSIEPQKEEDVPEQKKESVKVENEPESKPTEEVEKSTANLAVPPESTESEMQIQSQQDDDKGATKEDFSESKSEEQVQNEVEKQSPPKEPEPQSIFDQESVPLVQEPEVVVEQTVKESEPAAMFPEVNVKPQEPSKEKKVVEETELAVEEQKTASTEEPVIPSESKSNSWWTDFWDGVAEWFSEAATSIKSFFTGLFS